jgi:hypothetical protein
MIKSILVCTALFALASAAQAGEVTVRLAGKSDAAIRAELHEAAKTACLDVGVIDYAPCVQETYQNALDEAAKAKTSK